MNKYECVSVVSEIMSMIRFYCLFEYSLLICGGDTDPKRRQLCFYISFFKMSELQFELVP